jgi:hypothetical protein
MRQQHGDVLIGSGLLVGAMALTYLVSGPGAVIGLIWLALSGKLALHLLSRDQGARLFGTLLVPAVLLRHLMPRRFKRLIEQWRQDGVPPKLDAVE